MDRPAFVRLTSAGTHIDHDTTFGKGHGGSHRRCPAVIIGWIAKHVGAHGIPLTFAGLYETWWDKSRSEELDPETMLRTCTIITTNAGADMVDVHDRMPVIIERPDCDAWLDPDQHDTEVLSKLLLPAAMALANCVAPRPSDQMPGEPVRRHSAHPREPIGPSTLKRLSTINPLGIAPSFGRHQRHGSELNLGPSHGSAIPGGLREGCKLPILRSGCHDCRTSTTIAD